MCWQQLSLIDFSLLKRLVQWRSTSLPISTTMMRSPNKRMLKRNLSSWKVYRGARTQLISVYFKRSCSGTGLEWRISKFCRKEIKIVGSLTPQISSDRFLRWSCLLSSIVEYIIRELVSLYQRPLLVMIRVLLFLRWREVNRTHKAPKWRMNIISFI